MNFSHKYDEFTTDKSKVVSRENREIVKDIFNYRSIEKIYDNILSKELSNNYLEKINLKFKLKSL